MKRLLVFGDMVATCGAMACAAEEAVFVAKAAAEKPARESGKTEKK